MSSATIRPASQEDVNPRPTKRHRAASPSSDLEEGPAFAPSPSLSELPPSILLVSLPNMLVHPPTHRHHARSLCISMLALRKCLSLPNLTPDIECRAWTALAEIGMIAISGGFSQNEDHLWARSIELEVEKAAGHALNISEKHPSLRLYRPYVTCILAQLGQWQQNTKWARNLLRTLVTKFLSVDPPHTIYSAHLNLISLLSTPADPTVGLTPKDTQSALSATRTFVSIAEKQQHRGVQLLGLVIQLRLLVSAGLWDRVEDALTEAEEVLGFSLLSPRDKDAPAVLTSISNTPATPGASTDPAAPDGSSSPAKASQSPLPLFPDNLTKIMAVHTLIIGVVFYTYVGNAACTASRLTPLHVLMDAGSWKDVPSGVVEIPFPNSPPLHVQTTHSRILFILTYLVSAIAKKDPVGRKPKRKTFALEGLLTWEKEMRKPVILPSWASVSDVEQLESTMARLKADLLCELVGVHIMRSEFPSAVKHLEGLVAHVRTAGIWDAFAARVLLYEAHLAHARTDAARAEDCYRIAAQLASEGPARDDYVGVCARAGIVALQIGRGDVDADEARMVVESCKGMGGTLRSVGKVIDACLTGEILKSKTALKSAMAITSDATDNHLRALILALTSSHFMHTATDYAMKMLGACQNLACGLGAGAVKGAKNTQGADLVGNIPLRIWTAERFLELHKRQGNGAQAEKQVRMIEALKKVSLSADASSSVV